MFYINESLPKFSPKAYMVVNETFKEATENNMVRIASTNGIHTEISSFRFNEQTPEAAMASALAFCRVEWSKHVPLSKVWSELTAYTTCCLECGNSVCTGEDGNYVCPNPKCTHHLAWAG